jgi:rod shape-determining protein MreD
MTERRLKWEQRVLRQVLRALIMLGVALVQTSLAPTLWRFRVDWVLLVVVGWTILRGLMPGVRLALYGGISLDLLSSMPLGSHVFALLLCVSVIAVLTEPLERDQPMLILATMLLSAMLYGFTLMVVLQLSSSAIPWQRYPLVVVVPAALINTIFALPAFALLRRYHVRSQSPSAIELF